jgi:hypothetical protein
MERLPDVNGSVKYSHTACQSRPIAHGQYPTQKFSNQALGRSAAFLYFLAFFFPFFCDGFAVRSRATASPDFNGYSDSLF